MHGQSKLLQLQTQSKPTQNGSSTEKNDIPGQIEEPSLHRRFGPSKKAYTSHPVFGHVYFTYDYDWTKPDNGLCASSSSTVAHRLAGRAGGEDAVIIVNLRLMVRLIWISARAGTVHPETRVLLRRLPTTIYFIFSTVVREMQIIRDRNGLWE